VLTKLLPGFTDAQVGLVARLMRRSRDDLRKICNWSGHLAHDSMSKQGLIAKILRELADEKLQRELCKHDAARHIWFGFDPPKAGEEAKEPGLFDGLEE
jgi:hypothetical protein